jgi:hypothetical protein
MNRLQRLKQTFLKLSDFSCTTLLASAQNKQRETETFFLPSSLFTNGLAPAEFSTLN